MWSSPEIESAFARTHELCREFGETPHLVPALTGLTGFHIVRGELQAARELAERLVALGQRTSDTDVLVEAHYLADDGLRMVTEGFRVASKNDEYIVEAELYRLGG